MDGDAAKTIDGLEKEVRDLKEEIIGLQKALGNGVEEMLARRGFRIYRKERDKEVLKSGAQFKEEFYSLMGKYSFRLFLRDVIKYLPKSSLGATPVVRWKDELFRVGERIFIVDSKGGFIQNIKYVIATFLKERAWQAA